MLTYFKVDLIVDSWIVANSVRNRSQESITFEILFDNILTLYDPGGGGV